jgi:hypothetical protein
MDINSSFVEKALTLSEEERVRLIETLMLSLGETSSRIDEYWADVAVQRRDELLRNPAAGQPFSELMQQLRKP